MAESHVFYHAIIRVCDGAMTLSKRYAEACRRKAETAAPDRRGELLKMADSLDWIMENPARTYWEGLQAILFYELLLISDAQQHGQSMGRVDKYVGHLLQKELDEGTITMEKAQEYSDAFILRIYDFIALPGFFINNKNIIAVNESGGNLFSSIYNGMTATAGIALTLGGSTPDGRDDTTPATALLLQTYGRMALPDPTVALRINKNTPDEIWRLGLESSKVCGGIPQLQNDDIIVKGLMDTGMSEEDAYNYSIVGCVEPAGTGCEWPACGMTGRESIWNMMDVVQLAINGGVNPRSGKTAVPCKKLYEYDSFEEFKQSFETEMKFALDWTVSYSNMFEMVYSHYFPCIAASAMMEGCLESGRDVTAGGSKYNRTGLTACGTGNVGDSLMTIKKLCFDDKTVPLETLYDALRKNWKAMRTCARRSSTTCRITATTKRRSTLWRPGRSSFRGHHVQGKGGRGVTIRRYVHHDGQHLYGQNVGATRTAAWPASRSRRHLLSPGLDINGPTAYLRSAPSCRIAR
jgi:formate C-acetyltransferase